MTDMAPHFVLEPGVVAADARGRLGRQLERHEDMYRWLRLMGLSGW